jgi:hypothetical protein
MFFKNEDMLAIHTVSRAAFRVLYDLTGESDVKKALTAHIEKVGAQRFNEETNFLKHADQDPGGEIDDNFHVYTEAGIGMAIGLYKGQKEDLTPEMASFLAWSTFVRPGFYDLGEEVAEYVEEWNRSSKTDPNKIEDVAKNRSFGDAILHWCRLNWSKLTASRLAAQQARAQKT